MRNREKIINKMRNREKIINKLKDGVLYLSLDLSIVDLFCPKCNKILGFESNAFAGSLFCENINCEIFGKRFGALEKSFLGNVEFHRNKLIMFLSKEERKEVLESLKIKEEQN